MYLYIISSRANARMANLVRNKRRLWQFGGKSRCWRMLLSAWWVLFRSAGMPDGSPSSWWGTRHESPWCQKLSLESNSFVLPPTGCNTLEVKSIMNLVFSSRSAFFHPRECDRLGHVPSSFGTVRVLVWRSWWPVTLLSLWVSTLLQGKCHVT